MAMYNAIEDANKKYAGGVDAIITPKYTSSVSGFPPFWWNLKVKIKGKGIRFITKQYAIFIETKEENIKSKKKNL